MKMPLPKNTRTTLAVFNLNNNDVWVQLNSEARKPGLFKSNFIASCNVQDLLLENPQNPEFSKCKLRKHFERKLVLEVWKTPVNRFQETHLFKYILPTFDFIKQ